MELLILLLSSWGGFIHSEVSNAEAKDFLELPGDDDTTTTREQGRKVNGVAFSPTQFVIKSPPLRMLQENSSSGISLMKSWGFE